MRNLNIFLRITPLLMILFSFALVPLSAQSKASSKKAKVPEIQFEKTVHDYGNIKQGDDGECEFIFKNTGREPLILTNVYSSCGCTVPSWPKEPIMPGKSEVIKVKYNTSRLGTINKKVTVISNATNSPVELFIKGNVSPLPTENLPEKSQSPMETKKPVQPF